MSEEFLDGYTIAILESYGLRTDSEDPEDYLEGYLFAQRYDAIKCNAGNKPCGKRCIPMKAKCKTGAGGMAAKIGAGAALAGAAAFGVKKLRERKSYQGEDGRLRKKAPTSAKQREKMRNKGAYEYDPNEATSMASLNRTREANAQQKAKSEAFESGGRRRSTRSNPNTLENLNSKLRNEEAGFGVQNPQSGRGPEQVREFGASNQKRAAAEQYGPSAPDTRRRRTRSSASK